MSKFKNLITIFILFAIICPTYGQSQNLTGRDIMTKVDERPEGKNTRMILNMKLINKRGKVREREVLSYSKKYGVDEKTLMYFQKPADVKGTAFLSWEYDEPGQDDDQWLYLPALKKSRRISGSSKNDYFMGTDFTYDDMGDRNVDEDNHKFLRDENVNGHDCWVVESIPKDKNYMYSKVISWIWKDTLVATKVEYYDQKGILLKTLENTDIRKHQGYWTIFKMVMDNIQENHKTILEFSQIDYDTAVEDNLFRVSTIERGNIK